MPVPVKLPVMEIQITLSWKDGYGETHKSFDTVKQFADFLRDNPELARTIGYVKKN